MCQESNVVHLISSSSSSSSPLCPPVVFSSKRLFRLLWIHTCTMVLVIIATVLKIITEYDDKSCDTPVRYICSSLENFRWHQLFNWLSYCCSEEYPMYHSLIREVSKTGNNFPYNNKNRAKTEQINTYGKWKNTQDINTIYKIIILHLFTFRHHLTLATTHMQTHTHMNGFTLGQVADLHLMRQGQWKVTETLNVHHTDYKPDGMPCFSVCVRVCESEWVGEDMAVGRHVGLQDGVGVSVSLSGRDGWSPVSVC